VFNVKCKWFTWANSDVLSNEPGNGVPADWQGVDSDLTMSYGCRACPDGFPDCADGCEDGFEISKYCDPENESCERNYVNCPNYKERI
jgi:hypothetical protein